MRLPFFVVEEIRKGGWDEWSSSRSYREGVATNTAFHNAGFNLRHLWAVLVNLQHPEESTFR